MNLILPHHRRAHHRPLDPPSYENFKDPMSSQASPPIRVHHICYNCFRTGSELHPSNENTNTENDGRTENDVVLQRVHREKGHIHTKRRFCHLVDKSMGQVLRLQDDEVSEGDEWIDEDEENNEGRLYVAQKKRTRAGNEQITVLVPLLLCQQCVIYLTTDDEKACHDYNNCWCAMMWHVFSHQRTLRDKYCAEQLWSLIPLKWKEWWIDSVKKMRRRGRNLNTRDNYNMSPYEDVELNATHSFDDVTEDFYSIQKVKEEKKIESLLPYWNTHCVVPEVRCPWGCTEMMDDAGMIKFHDVLKHYLDEFIWAKDMNCIGDHRNMKQKMEDLLEGARADYLGYCGNIGQKIPAASPLLPGMTPGRTVSKSKTSCPMVRPCVIIHRTKGPMVLTCKEHNGGKHILKEFAPARLFSSILLISSCPSSSYIFFDTRFHKEIFAPTDKS